VSTEQKYAECLDELSAVGNRVFGLEKTKRAVDELVRKADA
jgi:hypothetical protein